MCLVFEPISDSVWEWLEIRNLVRNRNFLLSIRWDFFILCVENAISDFKKKTVFDPMRAWSSSIINKVIKILETAIKKKETVSRVITGKEMFQYYFVL